MNYLDTGNITDNVVEKIQHIDINKEILPSRARRKVNYNSILFSSVRPNQRHFGIIKSMPDNFLVSTGFVVVDALTNFVDSDYLYFWLTQREVVELLHSIAEQSVSAYPSIKSSDIENLEIKLPPIEIQKRIASILRSISEKIQLNNHINDNLEQQATVLVNRYLSVITETVAFSEIIDFVNGFAFQSRTYLPAGQYRIITIKNVQDGKIDSTGASCIDCLPQRMKTNCILQIGDVLLSLTGNVGRVGIVCENNLLLNQRVAKFVPHRKELLPFLYFIFRHPSIKTQMESIAKGTAQLNLSPIETLNLSVPFEKTKALELSKVLSPIYQFIISNNQQNILLSSLRDELLPKLMSGEIDISDIKI